MPIVSKRFFQIPAALLVAAILTSCALCYFNHQSIAPHLAQLMPLRYTIHNWFRNEVTCAATDAQPQSSLPPRYHLTFDDEFNSLSISDSDGAGTRWYSQPIHCCIFDTSSPATPTHMAGLSAPDGQRPFALLPGQGF